MAEAGAAYDSNLAPAEVAEIEEAVRAAHADGKTRWVACVREVDSIDVLGCYARTLDSDRFYWERESVDLRFVATGRADEIESAGRERFRDVEDWAARVRSRIHWLGSPRPETAPLLLGGFGFEETARSESKWKSFPAARFVLPAVIGEVSAGVARWTWIVRVEPGIAREQVEHQLNERLAASHAMQACLESSETGTPGLSESGARARVDDLVDLAHAADPDGASGPEYRVRADRAHAVFEAQVRAALARIDEGAFEKVVLARSLRVDHDGPLDVAGFIARLRNLYPSCTFFSMGRGQDTFLAATPETLVRLCSDRVSTAALAGSAPRGRTPEEDRDFANVLVSSDKERAEHAHVVEALRAVLVERCDELSTPREPVIRRLFGIQHLETEISGRLSAPDPRTAGGGRTQDYSILPLVEALHPTPAVGGAPREPARDFLRRVEGLERGWYAAPVGWLDGAGGGDFSVALRSALIHASNESRAWLFAGAGIVAGSVPEQELAETRIKLRALLAPLTEI